MQKCWVCVPIYCNGCASHICSMAAIFVHVKFMYNDRGAETLCMYGHVHTWTHINVLMYIPSYTSKCIHSYIHG